MFSGKLKSCNDRNKDKAEDCIGYFEITLASQKLIHDLQGGNITILVPRVWKNPRSFDFDNMGNALLTLLEMLSLEGWTDVRDTIQDGKPEVSTLLGIMFPHMYVLLTALLVLTLFIGIIVSSFNESKVSIS